MNYIILSQGRVTAISNLKNNLMRRGSIAKINLVLGSNMEINLFGGCSKGPKINLESKGLRWACCGRNVNEHI